MLYFNGGSMPLVPEGRWGEGVIMPGEPYETDAILGSPWVQDPEAVAALQGLREATAGDGSQSSPEAPSGPQDAQQAPQEGVQPESEPEVHVDPSGDVVNDSTGQVVGHLDPPTDSPPSSAAN